MLGSWAMIQAVTADIQNGVLPTMFTGSNVVYAVGTAAIGDQLGLANCSGGCNQLNGYCFALQFNGPPAPNYPYMIFQSVNIGANNNSFDIYMAGGGTGAFSQYCPTFWGTTNVNWAANIENASSCAAYFNNYQGFNSQYSVTYNGTVHSALTTLENACTFASSAVTGFNTKNWTNVAVVPVTCPKSLTQITGVEIPSTVTTVGNQPITNLANLTAQSFAKSTMTPVTTTQMQDCKTPSSGFCGNVPASQPNYEASISASLTAPLLNSSTPSTFGTLCVTVPAPTGYTGTAFPTISAAGPSAYIIKITGFGTAACTSNVAVGTYTLTGSVLTNANGQTFNPTSSPSATVNQNATTNATVTYTTQAMGTLAVSVTGGSNCSISPTQTFNVTYTSGATSKTLMVTGTTPASTSVPAGTYTISVTPATLPSNAQCSATYNNSVSITPNATVNEKINYTYTQPASCAMTAQCSTWGTPQNPWAGSTCNFAITQPTGLTNPTVVTMTTLGITAITGAWNANVTLANGQVSAQLTNPVYVTNFGFNANGVITAPPSATLTTNGKSYTCTVTSTAAKMRKIN